MCLIAMVDEGKRHCVCKKKGTYYLGIKIFNNLPVEFKNIAGNQIKFKISLKKFFTHLLILHN